MVIAVVVIAVVVIAVVVIAIIVAVVAVVTATATAITTLAYDALLIFCVTLGGHRVVVFIATVFRGPAVGAGSARSEFFRVVVAFAVDVHIAAEGRIAAAVPIVRPKYGESYRSGWVVPSAQGRLITDRVAERHRGCRLRR